MDSKALHKAYVTQTASRRVESSRIGCIVAMIFMPLGALVDYVLYRDMMAELTMVRLVCEALLLLIYPLHLLKQAKTHIKAINLSFPMVCALTMCVIIYLTEGINGPYYAGLSMLILGVSLLLPFSFLEAVGFVLFTIICYIISGVLWLYIGDINVSKVFNNLYFLISTGIIASTASYFAEKSRFREFQLNYQLDQRNKELAKLDKIKSDFYANVSHEFRTPLTLILSPIEDLLLRTEFDKKTKMHLGHIKDNAYRLLKLVNDLLDVLKIEEKKDFLEKQPVELNRLLENICSGMDSLAKRKLVNLELRAPDSRLFVNGDEVALEKVFINLLSNAIKFTQQGGSVVVKVDADGKKIRVDVVDTGAGISEKDLPYIFERFQQADSSITKKNQGTGLGLALVKELTQLHGGEIFVESRQGQGTTMHIVLPNFTEKASKDFIDLENDKPLQGIDSLQELHRAADRIAAEDGVKPTEQPKAIPINKNAPSLVIVEDEKGIREYLSETLSTEYKVSVAADGLEGLNLIQKTRPDLIVLDYMLPSMDGMTICEAVKNDENLRASKVIMLTAKTDENTKLHALQKGADDFLTKPFSTVEIKSRLSNMWNTSELQRNVEKRNRELSEALDELTETQGQLIQSEKLNALGRLAAGLLHEVNNPLNFAFATAQLLEREEAIKQDEYAKDLMADIKTGMERISAIVKDLKAFAHPETSDLNAVFSLQTAIESAQRFTATKTRGIEIQNQTSDEMLVGSQSHIVQVMVNLLENAADAMAEQEYPKIISIRSEQLDSGRVKLIFRDNGPGMPDQIKDKIFDPFYTTKDVGEGMGMGLSICHTIIENHQGALAVESEQGSYTEFTFDLGDANKMQYDDEDTETAQGELH